jgi:hypothetical protein
MSKLLWNLVFVAMTPLLLASPAGATDLLEFDNGYAPYAEPLPYSTEPDLAYERSYAPPDAYIRYPNPAYGHPNYRDVARYCDPDNWALANGYVPPPWCFPEGPARAFDPSGVSIPRIYGRDYPAPGYAPRPAPDGSFGRNPNRARYELNSAYPLR